MIVPTRSHFRNAASELPHPFLLFKLTSSTLARDRTHAFSVWERSLRTPTPWRTPGALRTSSRFPRRPRPRPHPWPVRHVFPAASTGTHSTAELGPGTRCGPSRKLEQYQRDASTGRRPHRTTHRAYCAAQHERNPSTFNTPSLPLTATPANSEVTPQPRSHTQAGMHRAQFSVRRSVAFWHLPLLPCTQPASPWGLRKRPRRSRRSHDGGRRGAGTTRSPR
jgi:hypothetical protein